MIQKCGEKLDLPTEAKELRLLRKGDERKALMAALIRWRTATSTEWIATRLQMGHPGSVSRQVGIVNKDRKLLKKLNKLEKNVPLRGLTPENPLGINVQIHVYDLAR